MYKGNTLLAPSVWASWVHCDSTLSFIIPRAKRAKLWAEEVPEYSFLTELHRQSPASSPAFLPCLLPAAVNHSAPRVLTGQQPRAACWLWWVSLQDEWPHKESCGGRTPCWMRSLKALRKDRSCMTGHKLSHYTSDLILVIFVIERNMDNNLSWKSLHDVLVNNIKQS